MLPRDRVYEVVDRVMLAGPSGWSELELELTAVGDVLVVAGSRATPSSDWPEPEVVLADAFVQKGLLIKAIDGLRLALAGKGTVWDATGMTIRRIPGAAWEVVLLDTAGIAGRFFLDPSDLIAAPELLAELARLGRAPERQDAFAAAVAGHTRWNLRPADGLLDLVFPDRQVQTYKAHVIGSFAGADETWRWSWANPAFEVYPRLTAASRELQERAQRGAPGMGALRVPGFATCSRFARALALLAGDLMGGFAVYAAPVAQPALDLFLAVEPD